MANPYKKRNDKHAKNFNTPCKYFIRGKCNNAHCPYLHVKGNHSNGNASTGDKMEQHTAASGILQTMLKLFFEKQQSSIYAAELGILDLSDLLRYDDLKPIASSIDFNTMSFCEALFANVKELIQPPPPVLRLDHNHIKTVLPLVKALEANHLHEGLRALSLCSNTLGNNTNANNVNDGIFDVLKRLKDLNEVHLVGNPLCEEPNYRARVKKALPHLLGLDGAAIVSPPLALPWPIFKDPSAPPPTSEDGASTAYDADQQHVLHFIQNSILAPLEANQGVDAVSDAYATHAILTFSCSTQDALVELPKKAGTSYHRDCVRDLVGFKMRQREANHNILLGTKSAQVASGRTKVCAQLEHWMYPCGFEVRHCLHASPSVVVLDNRGMGPKAVVGVKEAISIVSVHGVMMWSYKGSSTSSSPACIKRNMARTWVVSRVEAGRWQVANDMITIFPFSGTMPEAMAGGEVADLITADLHDYDMVFAPAVDPNRAARLGRRYHVPANVVATLLRCTKSDAELITILSDLRDAPLELYENCARMVEMEPIPAIVLCRAVVRLGVSPEVGVELMRQHGLDWIAIETAVAASTATPSSS